MPRWKAGHVGSVAVRCPAFLFVHRQKPDLEKQHQKVAYFLLGENIDPQIEGFRASEENSGKVPCPCSGIENPVRKKAQPPCPDGEILLRRT